MAKEKAIMAKMPSRLKGGMGKIPLLKPEKLKERILKPGTTKETKYKATAPFIQRKSPKVIKFKGRRRILIIGLAISEETARPRAARSNVSTPWLKIMPDAIWVTI